MEYKRGRKDETDIAIRMTWVSRCGTFAVQQCKNKYSKNTYYYALVYDGDKFRMIEHMKRYRTRLAAEKAVENFVKGKK